MKNATGLWDKNDEPEVFILTKETVVDNKRIENARTKEAESRAEEAVSSAEEQKIRTERQKVDLERDRFRLESDKAEEEQQRQIRAERHAAEMKRMEPDEDFKQAQLALLTGLAVMIPELQKMTTVFCNQYEFGSANAIRASACALLKEAAVQEGTPEAKEECAAKLLEISDGMMPTGIKKPQRKKRSAA